MIARALSPGWINAVLRSQSGSLWILAERITGNLLNFLAILAIMRFLGPVAYGHWAFAFSVISVLLVTGHLGLDGLLVRKLVEQPEQAGVLLGVTAALKYTVYLPAIAATLAFFEIRAGIDDAERTLLYVLMIAVLAAPLTSSLTAWSNARSKFGPIARARMVAVAVGFAAKLGLIGAGYGVVTVGLAHSAMFTLEAVILLYVVKRCGGPLPWHWRFERAAAQELLGQSLFLFIATICATLYLSADVIVLRAFGGAREVGLYALVPQVILASQMVPYAVTLARFPALTQAVGSATGDRRGFTAAIWRSLRDLVALSLLAMAGLALFIWVAFDWVFGPAYAETKPVLWLACLAFPPIFVRQLTTKLYILTDQGARLAVIEFAGLLVILALLLAGVPAYGGIAAIIAVSIGLWLTVILSLLLIGGAEWPTIRSPRG